MIQIRVEGGTNAGRRRIKSAPKPWACKCGPRAPYLRRCPTCGAYYDEGT